MQLYYTFDRLTTDDKYYEAMTADNNPGYPFTDIAIPDGLTQPKYDWSTQKWVDASAQAAEQRQQEAEEKATKLEAENKAQAEQLKEVQAQTGTLFDQLNGLSAFLGQHTELLTDEQAIALTGFVPAWSAQLGTLKVNQVVLDPDNHEPYRVLVEHVAAQDKIPGKDTTDFAKINTGAANAVSTNAPA